MVAKGRGVSPGPFASAWRYRGLLRQLVRRDVESRFRGSILGKTWAFLLPLVMLALYTFVFGVIIQPRWQYAAQSRVVIGLTYFSGLIVFDFFFECLSRAPSLVIEHLSYVKRIVFPLEILGWMVLGNAMFRLAVSSAMLLLFYVALAGAPPLAALTIPFLIAPLALFAIGFVWLLASLGVYIRDIRQAIMLASPIIMFLSPVFFPLTAVPGQYLPLLYLNPLTFVLEAVRAALFEGEWPVSLGYPLYVLAAWLFARFGYALFARLRPGFADVL